MSNRLVVGDFPDGFLMYRKQAGSPIRYRWISYDEIPWC